MQIVLATSAVAETKRLQFWRDAVCDTFVELDCRAVSEAPFFGEITTAQCDEMHFSRVRSDGQIVDRTKSRIRNAREEIVLVSVQTRGRGVVAQDGRQAVLEPGDFACYDSTRPYTLSFDAPFEQIVLHLPRKAMVRRIGATEAVTATRVAAASPLGSLVAPFIRNTAAIVSAVDGITAGRLSDVCLGLVTTALGDLTLRQSVNDTPARAALMFRAKALIERNLGDEHLNSEKIAAMMSISPRYLQDLFHSENETVSEWIWSRRLEKARRDLLDPLLARESITQIALAGGFCDLAHFSRRFKAAYAMTPREYRYLQLSGTNSAARNPTES
jgi:AraC-like DNA-binding protein